VQKEQIYNAAVARIDARRHAARLEQERRTDEIMRRIPEAVELDRQLRSVCMRVFEAAGKEDREKRLAAIQKQTAEADRMLRAILTANGYPEDYLDIHYSCPICNDSGFHEGRRCECLQREISALAADAINQESQLALSQFDTFSLQYYSDLPQNEAAAMQRILQHCKNYAELFTPGESDSLLMLGKPGLGKTHLSLAIASVLIERGFTVIYDSVGALLHKLELEHFGRSKSEEDTLSSVLECDLLILDDFGTEFDTAFTQSQIYTILNSRMNARRATIINTNLTLEELRAHYGERIFSRLVTSKIMQFYGKDIRLKKRQGGST
jgi:DNA replication protein DnaC